MLQSDELVRLVRLIDAARAADHGWNSNFGKQPGLGAETHLAGAGITAAAELHAEPGDGVAVVGVEAGELRQLLKSDRAPRMHRAHFRQNFTLHKRAQLGK